MQNKKIQFLIISVIVLAGINIALIAFMIINKPEPIPPRSRTHNNRGARFLENKMGFTPDQKQQFDRLFSIHRHKKDSIEDLIRREKHQMIISLINDKNDSINAELRLQKIEELHKANEREFYQHFRQLKKISSKEQLEKLHGIIQRADRGRH